jgi:hypothetical protein
MLGVAGLLDGNFADRIRTTLFDLVVELHRRRGVVYAQARGLDKRYRDIADCRRICLAVRPFVGWSVRERWQAVAASVSTVATSSGGI